MGVKIMKRMHRLSMCLGVLMLLLPPALAFSQDTFNYRSDHYSVTTRIDQEFTEDTAVFMEAFFDLYTSYLHFDPELLDYNLKVRIFDSKAEYDKFLQDVIGETRSSFVFLHYPDSKKSELVAYHLDDQN